MLSRVGLPVRPALDFEYRHLARANVLVEFPIHRCRPLHRVMGMAECVDLTLAIPLPIACLYPVARLHRQQTLLGDVRDVLSLGDVIDELAVLAARVLALVERLRYAI